MLKLYVFQEVLYANNPAKISESSENMYHSIHGRYNDVTNEHYVDAGSKANLLLDSDSSTFGSIGSGRNRQGKKYESTDTISMEHDGTAGCGDACTLDIYRIEDMGKDCITVVSVEHANGNDKGNMSATYGASNVPSIEYTEIIVAKQAENIGLDNEDGYLNEELDCNATVPDTHHYMEMANDGPGIDSNDTMSGIHMDKTNVSPEIKNYDDKTLIDTQNDYQDNQQYDQLDERHIGVREENAESNVYTEL